ncbi:MAG: CRISPR system precrRNA processing endoribonuclease RAMP protein Cas6 [Rhodocyclaceae bacterium]|nr:CRISPR system precrRNA processing endoribonuclease RAMP protein Cas6 [Rhodocyclaceae bacterium]
MILPPLPLARYRLEFEVKQSLRLPAYAGSTLRGGWGKALRHLACLTRQPTCDGCRLLATCPYVVIFETRPPAGGASLQDFSQIPRPYVIEPPAMGEHTYSPGEPLVFHLVLVGRALAHLELILSAYNIAFRRGVSDGTAELKRVTHLGLQEEIVLAGAQSRILPPQPAIPPPPSLGTSVTLQFHTPLRLQTNGRRATKDEITTRKLLMAIVRRVALLYEFHGSGPLVLDFSQLARRAEAIASRLRMQWCDPARYSSRQNARLPLGGLIGEWTLAGDLAPFTPFLHLGQWLHVGKEATFGLGGYRLLPEAPQSNTRLVSNAASA